MANYELWLDESGDFVKDLFGEEVPSIVEGLLNETNEIVIQTNMGLEEVEKSILKIQAKMNMNVSEYTFLDIERITEVLSKCFDVIKRPQLYPISSNETINIIRLWNEGRDDVEVELDTFDSKGMVFDKEILLAANSQSSYFKFIDITYRPPKWADNILVEPLTMEVTHNGVLINGLYIISDQKRLDISKFYPSSQFFSENSLFFSFEDFPHYSYSFSWNGRYISIREVEEYEEKPSEIIRELNIGYYFLDNDIVYPVKNNADFKKALNHMRLL